MRVLHWLVAHNDPVFFAVNGTVAQPGFHFCEGSARANFWCKYFFELAISTRIYIPRVVCRGADSRRAIDA